MLKNFTLLYVEDDLETVDNIKDILLPRVKELYIAFDGLEGFEVYKDKKPDIVVTDINMPKLNGIEMAKKIKEIDNTQSILILTAFNENHLLHDSVDIGVDGYITKPIIDIDKLLNPIKKSADRLQGYLDKKSLEKMLQIQNKNAAIGEMVSNISHQWRQPLSVISTYVSSLEVSLSFGDEVTKEDILDCAKEVNKQSQYLSQTIDDFRSFFSADTTLSQKIDLKDVLEKTILLVEHSLKNNFIELQLDINKSVNIEANENQIIQALINIINNAKDVMTDNKDEKNVLFITLKKDKKNAIIVIKDTGFGINKDIIDKIFEPYFTTKHSSVGTGLGLYMTERIIKQLEGFIYVENVDFEYEDKKLKGAEFIIKLPLA